MYFIFGIQADAPPRPDTVLQNLHLSRSRDIVVRLLMAQRATQSDFLYISTKAITRGFHG